MKNDELNLLKKILTQHKEIDYWEIIKKTEKKYNLYITKNSQHENYMHGIREDYIVIVYKKFGNELGEATVTIVDFDESSVKQKITEALLAASLSKNPFYEPFAEKSETPKIKLHDTVFEKRSPEIQKKIENFAGQMLSEVKQNKKVKFTGAEILTLDTDSELITNKGHNLKHRKSAVYVELVLTAVGKRGEVEFLADKKETTFEKFDIVEFVNEAATIVTAISDAVGPKAFSGPVILTGPAIMEFFVLTFGLNPIIVNASAGAKYMNVSKFKLGKPIADFKGEKLTLNSNALIPQGLMSVLFDINCVPSKNLTVIENGILKNMISAKQFADYLKVKPTGALGNIQIPAGKLSVSDLYKTKTPVVEIQSFSWFDPSPYAGDFASEVRLGYLIKNGKRIPFKGGLLIGAVFDAIANANYSKETIESAGYYGPKAVRFNKLVLSGL